MLLEVCSCTCVYIPACSQGLLLDHPTSLPSFPLTLHMQTPNWEQRPQKSPPSTGPEGTETQGTKGHEPFGHREATEEDALLLDVHEASCRRMRTMPDVSYQCPFSFCQHTRGAKGVLSTEQAHFRETSLTKKSPE